jgi:hypothetical protein
MDEISPEDESVFDICDEILEALKEPNGAAVLDNIKQNLPRLFTALNRLKALDNV